jgi:hypothetical protein
MQDLTKLLAILALATAATVMPAAAEDFPRSGYDGAINGQSAPFAGNWSLGYPEPEGTIVAETIIGCEDPVRIEAVAETVLGFKTPAMPAPAVYELSELVEGRTTWLPGDNSQSVIAVWLTPDRFHFYATNMGKADWENPQLMRRCPAD